MTAIQFQSSPLSLALQPVKSSYEQLVEWLKQLITRASVARREFSSDCYNVSLSFSPSTLRYGCVDLTSVSVHAYSIEAEIQSAIQQLFVAHFAVCLNDHAAQRLNMLFGCEENWDGQGASDLDLASLNIASHFISIYDLRGKEVGVFMSADGNTVLNWPAPNGSGLVEIEFLPDGYSLFVSGMDDEKFFDFDDAGFEEAIERTL